jgi:hypothetical protein
MNSCNKSEYVTQLHEHPLSRQTALVYVCLVTRITACWVGGHGRKGKQVASYHILLLTTQMPRPNCEPSFPSYLDSPGRTGLGLSGQPYTPPPPGPAGRLENRFMEVKWWKKYVGNNRKSWIKKVKIKTQVEGLFIPTFTLQYYGLPGWLIVFKVENAIEVDVSK